MTTITLSKTVETTGGLFRDYQREKVVCKNTDIDEIILDACKLLNASTNMQEAFVEGELFSFHIDKETCTILGHVNYEFFGEKELF